MQTASVVSAVLPVKQSHDGALDNEWRMVELQGTLAVNGARKGEEQQLAGFGLGELSYEGVSSESIVSCWLILNTRDVCWPSDLSMDD
jgi:hypothetical protein